MKLIKLDAITDDDGKRKKAYRREKTHAGSKHEFWLCAQMSKVETDERFKTIKKTGRDRKTDE